MSTKSMKVGEKIAAIQTAMMKKMRRVSPFSIAMSTPMLGYQVIFFLIPVCYIFLLSLYRVEFFATVPAFTAENWIHIWSQDYFWSAFGYSVLIGTVTAILSSVISLPIALYLGLSQSFLWRFLCLGIVIAPFFTNFVIRAHTWRGILGESGPINTLIRYVGGQSIQLVDSLVGTIIGTLSLSLPLVLLLQTLSISAVDRTLISAGLNLNARPVQAIFHIILPAARVGLALGFAFSFVLSFGDFISPTIIGASRPPVLSTLLVEQIRGGNHWPRASVVAVSMFTFLFTLVLATILWAYKEPGGEKK